MRATWGSTSSSRATTRSRNRKDKILLTVCDTGSTAGKAADLLRRAGYANVFNIRGGLATWRAENLPLVK